MSALTKYEVFIKSLPGFYAQYEGSVIVNAFDEEEAIENALSKLKNTSFPDRNNSMWKIQEVKTCQH